jgi:hypothetical protein
MVFLRAACLSLNRALPDNTTIFIFTDVAHETIVGSKVAYYSTDLDKMTAAATGSEITIGGTPYNYVLSADKNTLTLKTYGNAPATGTAPDVDFSRAKGYPGTGITGIWISDLPSNNAKYTLLMIKSGTAEVYASVGTNWGKDIAYALTYDANNTYIKWDNSTSNVVYTKYSDPVSLDIPNPVAAGTITGLQTVNF